MGPAGVHVRDSSSRPRGGASLRASGPAPPPPGPPRLNLDGVGVPSACARRRPVESPRRHLGSGPSLLRWESWRRRRPQPAERAPRPWDLAPRHLQRRLLLGPAIPAPTPGTTSPAAARTGSGYSFPFPERRARAEPEVSHRSRARASGTPQRQLRLRGKRRRSPGFRMEGLGLTRSAFGVTGPPRTYAAPLVGAQQRCEWRSGEGRGVVNVQGGWRTPGEGHLTWEISLCHLSWELDHLQDVPQP